MTISPNASTVWRNYETDGVPSSGNHKVGKAAVRTWGTAVETVIDAFTTNGGLIYQTMAAMNAAATTFTESRSAWQFEAGSEGVYVLNPTTDTWTKVGRLPYDFVIGADTGAGTANAIQITTDIPVADGMIVAFSLFEATTASPVTVSINGGAALTLKTNRGADASALTAGMEIWGRVRSSDNTLRLLNDQDVSALVAQAEAARDEAVAAAASQAAFDTEVLASAATIGAGVHAVRLNGSVTLGDGLGGLYIDTNNGATDTFTSNGGTRTWYRVADVGVDRLGPEIKAEADVLITVGTGGDYATVNDALAAASKLINRPYASGGLSVEVRLLTGFVWAEQVIVSALDLSFVTITSVAAVVNVTKAAITQSVNDGGGTPRYPLIAAINRGHAPTLGCVLDAQTPVNPQEIIGLFATNGGRLAVRSAAGVKNASCNCMLHTGGHVSTISPASGALWDEGKRPVFTGGVINAFVAYMGSTFDITGWDMDNSKDAFFAMASNGNAQRSRARNSTGDSAYLVRDGACVCARTTDASGAAGNGYTAYHAALLDARHFDDTGYSGANNCGAYGFSAMQGGIIDCTDGTALNCGKGAAKAQDAGIISARGLRANSGTEAALQAYYGGKISAPSSTITGGASVAAISTTSEGEVSCSDSTISAGATAISIALGGRVGANSSTISSTTDSAVLCQSGGVGVFYASVLRGSVAAVNCRRGGVVTVNAGDCRKNGSSEQSTDLIVTNGGIINAYGTQGGKSVTVGTFSSAGFIFT